MTYQGIIWVGLHIQDMEREIAFYRDVLGLRLVAQGEGWADFALGGGALLELMAGGTAAATPKRPDQQSLVVGFRVDDLDRATEELSGRGIQFIGEIGHHKATRWAHFADPEGNRLEIKEVPQRKDSNHGM